MFERAAHLDCGGFHTTRARMRGGTPLGALDIYIAPPPLEAWGAVTARVPTKVNPRVAAALKWGPKEESNLHRPQATGLGNGRTKRGQK